MPPLWQRARSNRLRCRLRWDFTLTVARRCSLICCGVSVGGILRGDFDARRPRAVHHPVDMHRPRLRQGRLDRPILHRLRAPEG